MRSLEDENLAQKLKETLDDELKSASLTRDELAGFKRAALKRPLSLRWQQFLERETQISITVVAACLVIVIGTGSYLANYLMRIHEVPAEPLFREEQEWHTNQEFFSQKGEWPC